MTEEKVKPQIVDVIIHGNYDQVSIVLDRMPEFIYERKPYSNLFGQDGDFVDAYGYETPSDNWKAFGGRKFEIPLTDGTVLQANGQWWSISPSQFVDEEVVSVGYCTLERLEECYVFFGGHIKKSALDEWLANNEPSNDYHKYKKQPNHPVLEPAPVTEQNLVTDETEGEEYGFNQFFLKYGSDFCRELLEEISECHLSGAGSKRVDIFDTLRHDELNFTYQGTLVVDGVEWWYTIDCGDVNGTVVKEWCLNNPSDADPIEEKPIEYSHNGLTRRMVVEAFEEVEKPPFGVDVWPHMINLKFDGICVQFYGPTVRTYSQGIETTQRWNDWKSLVGKQLNERGIDPEWWKKMKPAIQVIIDTMQIPETV